MLSVGDPLPADAVVWTTPQEAATIGEVAAGRAVLFLFYLFDWSAT